jgi:hypothetical protein
MPTGICAKMAKIFILKIRGYLGLRLIFMKIRHRDGSGKVRYFLDGGMSRSGLVRSLVSQMLRVHVQTSVRTQMRTQMYAPTHAYNHKHAHTCVCTNPSTRANALALHTCTHDTHKHAHTHARTHTRTYTHTCTCKHARIPACVQMHMHALHACTHVHYCTIHTCINKWGNLMGWGEKRGLMLKGFGLFGQA